MKIIAPSILRLFLILLPYFLFSCHSKPDQVQKESELLKYVCIDGIHDDPEILTADSLFLKGKLKEAASLFSKLKTNTSKQLYCQARLAEMDYYLRELYGKGHLNYEMQSSSLPAPQNAVDTFLLAIHDFYFLEDLDTSIFIREWNKVKGILGEDHYLVNKGNSIMGEYFQTMNFKDGLLDYYFKIHQNWCRRFPEKIYDCFWTNIRLTNSGTYTRDHLKSIANSNELIEGKGWKNILDSTHLSLAYSGRAYIQFRFDKFEEAFRDNEHAIKLSKDSLSIPVYQEALKSQLTVTNFWLKDSLWGFYILELRKSIDNSGVDYVNYHRHIARLYHERGDFTKAIPEQKLAIQYCTERRHLNLPVFQSLYHLYSTELENAGEYTRAIAEYRVTDIGHYDPEWKFANLIDSSLLSDAFQYVSLVRYGHIFFRWYLAENNSEYLKNAEQLALLARELYYKAAVTLEENALMTFAEERNTVLELLCQIYAEKYLRYHDADAFYKFHTYAEENRGAIFWKDVKSEWKFDSTLIRLLLVEQRLIAKDKQLRSVNHVDPDVLQNNIESLQKINDTIQKKYPVYYRQALNNQTPGIETIQDTLSNGNSSLIAFNFIDDKLYVEMIQTCAIDLFEVNITQERRNQLDTLITWMSTRNSVQANKYSSLAYSVWNWLIPDRIKEDTTFHWVIIPDGYVHKLNLEALVTEISEDDENFGSLKYLILKKEISYSPLIKSWMLHTPDSPLHDDNVVGFAWSDKKTVSSLNHTGLPELPGTISEMKNLRSGYPGAMIFDGKNATKENFIKSYCNSTTKLIELAVHGKASSYKRDDLMLYFRSHDGMVDTLFSYELIPLISGVETVILSACETGKGRILQGEGNYNLARYFLANGANSVITSLWKLDDKSFHLMSPIKMDTEKKSNFTLALRWDKLKLLKSGSKNNSPFYWAGIEIQS